MELYKMTPGRSGQFTTMTPNTRSKTIFIDPKERYVLADYKGAGIINRMWFTFTGIFYEHWNPPAPIDPQMMKDLILRIYWDNEPFPSVEVPMIDFFGVGFPEYRHYTSKYIALSSGGFTSYFQMPFEKGVKIEIENRHETIKAEIFMNVNYTALDKLPEGSGRFHAQYMQSGEKRTEKTLILNTKGKGKFVGCAVSMQAKQRNFLGFLEAPEYVFIDQEDTSDLSNPTFSGTGLEDYFNGGWYFREGIFHADLYGVVLLDKFNSMISMYRFHEEDAILFDQSIEFSFVWPLYNEHYEQVKYASTAYYYLDQASPLSTPLPEKSEMVDWYYTRPYDHISIP